MVHELDARALVLERLTLVIGEVAPAAVLALLHRRQRRDLTYNKVPRAERATGDERGIAQAVGRPRVCEESVGRCSGRAVVDDFDREGSERRIVDADDPRFPSIARQVTDPAISSEPAAVKDTDPLTLVPDGSLCASTTMAVKNPSAVASPPVTEFSPGTCANAAGTPVAAKPRTVSTATRASLRRVITLLLVAYRVRREGRYVVVALASGSAFDRGPNSPRCDRPGKSAGRCVRDQASRSSLLHVPCGASRVTRARDKGLTVCVQVSTTAVKASREARTCRAPPHRRPGKTPVRTAHPWST